MQDEVTVLIMILVPLKGWKGTILPHQNSIQDETKSRLKSGNVCYRSVQIFCLPVCYPEI